MIVQVVSVWALLCLSVQLGTKAEPKFENRAYSNVLVSFSPNVPSENGQIYLEYIQELLEITSRVLHKAFHVRIAEVIFILPPTWNTESWGLIPESKTTGETRTDILVDGTPDSAFGRRPFTVQFGGCGVPGKRITVPTAFLNTSIYNVQGTLLAREWMKYRYGVFDENGFPGDEMYPEHYFVPGNDEEVKVTECTDPPVEYILKDSNGDNCSFTRTSDPGDCKIYPGEMSTRDVKSSLMYFHEDLLDMQHFCGMGHAHNRLSPSKHNTLCAEKDIWSVVKESKDFKSAGVVTDQYSNVEFRFVQESRPRISVLWENTDAFHGKTRSLLFSVKRFLYDLPEGSNVSLHSFNENEVKRERDLSPLPPVANRDIISVNSPFETDGGAGVCPSCALEVAITELRDGAQDERGFIVLIVGSADAVLNTETFESLKDSRLCVTVVAYNGTESSLAEYASLLSHSECNSVVEIPAQEGMADTFEKMYEAMMATVPQLPADDITTTVASGTMSADSVLEIPADPMAGRFTLWLEKGTDVDGIVCTAEDGTNVAFTKVVDRIAYSFTSENAVTCRLRKQLMEARMAQVRMTTTPGQHFEEDAWIRDPTSGDQQMPIVIYAQMNFGHNPVSNANVTATVRDPDGHVVGEPLVLYDNGKGDPDITRNDGIYSRYFFQFSKEGDYEVTVDIDDNSGMAFVLKNGVDPCCGSQVQALDQEKVPPFRRTVRTSFSAKSGPPEGGYPPMRIIDLSVDKFEPPTMVLKWTAPGGEVDTGKASSYEFKLFCDSEEICRENATLPAWIMFNNSKPTPKETGETETAQLLFSREAPSNVTLLFGIATINTIHTTELSNRVQVRLPPLDEVVQPTTTAPSKIRELNYSSRGTIVGSVIAGVIFLICLSGLIYFLVDRRRSRKGTTDGMSDLRFETSNGTEKSNSFRAVDHVRAGGSSMRRVESFPVILYTHDQIKDFKNKKGREPPLFKANAAPKPWLSLGELPSGRSKTDDDRSEDSTCTVSANDKAESHEMRQLDDTSSSSDVQADKIAKF